MKKTNILLSLLLSLSMLSSALPVSVLAEDVSSEGSDELILEDHNQSDPTLSDNDGEELSSDLSYQEISIDLNTETSPEESNPNDVRGQSELLLDDPNGYDVIPDSSDYNPSDSMQANETNQEDLNTSNIIEVKKDELSLQEDSSLESLTNEQSIDSEPKNELNNSGSLNSNPSKKNETVSASDADDTSVEIENEDTVDDNNPYEPAVLLEQKMGFYTISAGYGTSKKATKVTGTHAQKIAKLRKQFPDGKYWNHKITSKHKSDWVEGDKLTDFGDPCNSFETVTNYPCGSHKNGTRTGNKNYSCNLYKTGVQCAGFAFLLAEKYSGTDCRMYPYGENVNKSTDVKNIKVGDVVHFYKTKYGSTGHYAFVIARNGNNLTLAEANYYYPCMIKWDNVESLTNADYYYRPRTSYSIRYMNNGGSGSMSNSSHYYGLT